MYKNKVYIDFSATERFPELDYGIKMAVRRAVCTTLEYEGFDQDAGVSVTFCDNAYIHKLNKKFRNVDRHTDVLSFPMYEDGDFSDAAVFGDAELGDIVISVERAMEQARELGHSFAREVAFLTVHSMLHLLGYDHERSAEDDEKQCARQREIIKKINIFGDSEV